jgi:hypothetical protein
VTPLQVLPDVDPALLRTAARVLAFALTSFLVAAIVSAAYRWYTRQRVSVGPPFLLGVAVVAIYLNTVGLFGDVLGTSSAPLFQLEAVVVNVVSLGVAAVAAPAGRVVGDRLATDVFAVTGARDLDAEVSRIVQSVGRVVSVELPDEEDIGDIDGYDPAAEGTKAELGGQTLLFPRRLNVSDLHDRLVTRIKEDYGVGHVDVELDENGTVTYLAIGSRVAGIGPTLGPGTVAVALKADPPNGAGPGDVVQVWRTGPAERVCTAELRSVADDVVTVAVDEPDAARLDAGTEYRLVMLPADPGVEREFAGLLRAADETMGVVTVDEGSDLVGEPVGSLDVTVVAVRPADEAVSAIPSRTLELGVGDVVYAVARPERIRRLETAGRSSETATDVDA